MLCSDPFKNPYPPGLFLLNDELGVLLRIEVFLSFAEYKVETNVFINDRLWKDLPKSRASEPSFDGEIIDGGEITLNNEFVKKVEQADFTLETLDRAIHSLRPITEIKILKGFKCQKKNSFVANHVLENIA